MGRVVTPLRQMGARIDGRQDGRLAPLAIRGGGLEAARHDLEVASAQVKSALLLAGLRCGVAVREPRRSRDHTERMLGAMGVELGRADDGWLQLRGEHTLTCTDVDVPGDLSSAAFLLVAGALVPGSEICLQGVGLNPTRSGVVDALRAMGADLHVEPREASGPEPQGDITVRHGPLHGTRIDGDLALRCLDELPVLAVAGAFAHGTTVIADAAELRVKESDRIARVATGLEALGVHVEEHPDGLTIEGGGARGPAVVDATGDHRIAMAFAVAGLVAAGGVRIDAADAVHSSWPTFFDDLAALGSGR
jgi:3-phosphoshikimate 1-carboxyvinyltransferase